MRTALHRALLLLLAVPALAGAQSFTDVWSSSGFSTSEVNQGVALGDYDGDGHTDVFLTSFLVDLPWPLPDLGGPDQCYRNSGSGSFSNRAAALGLDDPDTGQGAAWADWNNDDLLDLYVVRGFQEAVASPHLLYRQLPAGFDPSPSAYVSSAGAGRSVCWADYNADGFLDVFVTNGLDSTALLPDARVFLYHNNGDGTFTDITIAIGLEDRRNGHGCAWSDYDNDGDMDLYVANHGFEVGGIIQDPQANALYRNMFRETGTVRFQDVAATAGVTGIDAFDPAGAAFGCAWGDVNHDGWMDLYVTNGFSGNLAFNTPNRLYVNDANPPDVTFTDVSATAFTPPSVESSFGCTLGDYDNDGRLDIYVANSNIPLVAETRNDLYINQGFVPSPRFDNEAAAAGVDVQEWAQACASGDLDGDGWLDIYSINGVPGFELIFEESDNLFRNNGGSSHWLHLDLVGTISNRSAIGARVAVHIAGQIDQVREVSAGSGYQSMDDLRVEFGLGDATLVDFVHIRWPSGCMQTLTQVAADTVHTVVETCDAYILRDPMQGSVYDPNPMTVYQGAPPAGPWLDPAFVARDGTSWFYRHSDPFDIRVRRFGDTVRMDW